MRVDSTKAARRVGTRPRNWVLILATLVLFAFWGNSFIAIGYLLGSEGVAGRFDWVSLTVARFLTAGVLCAAYCLLFRREESLAILRRHWPRLLVCAVFAVPGYNFSLYYSQQHGVPARADRLPAPRLHGCRLLERRVEPGADRCAEQRRAQVEATTPAGQLTPVPPRPQ